MPQATTYDNLLFTFDTFRDSRGELTIAQVNEGHSLPFPVGRVFWITNTPAGCKRGMHAHKTCWEALVAVNGSFRVKVDDGENEERVFTLNTPQQGLLIPPMVWCELFDFTADAVCLCMASGGYDKEGYISDYAEFLGQCSQEEER